MRPLKLSKRQQRKRNCYCKQCAPYVEIDGGYYTPGLAHGVFPHLPRKPRPPRDGPVAAIAANPNTERVTA